jgi:hypothetical protein
VIFTYELTQYDNMKFYLSEVLFLKEPNNIM